MTTENKYFRELTLNLRRAGFTIGPEADILTPYGLLEREDGQPIHSMNEQPEQGGMEMRF